MNFAVRRGYLEKNPPPVSSFPPVTQRRNFLPAPPDLAPPASRWPSAHSPGRREWDLPQRGKVVQPRVARDELPWVIESKCSSTPTGLRHIVAHGGGRNPVGVVEKRNA